MSLRDSYKHLLGVPYRAGCDDCYGLARRYYWDVMGIEIVNAARPEGWWNSPDFDLINQFMSHDNWTKIGVNTKALKVGDGLVFSLINGKSNHVGVYVGNGMFIHHVLNRFSCEEALLDKWTSRLLMIIRHPDALELGHGMTPTTDYLTLLPEHIRARLIRSPQS